MRLLAFELEGSSLFKDKIRIELVNSESVRRLATDDDYIEHVYKIKPGIYTHVLLGIVGKNATGKTSILQFIDVLLKIIGENKALNYGEIRETLYKFININNAALTWTAYFIDEKNVYKWHAEIDKKERYGQRDFVFYYKNEYYKEKALTATNKKHLFDFDEVSKCKDRSELKDDEKRYLKEDQSIIDSLGLNANIISMVKIRNVNIPMWLGAPCTEILQCFDESVESVSITPNDDIEKPSNVELKLKTNPEGKYIGDISLLENMLSSGTVKGVNLFPSIINVLKYGGYLIIDEIENHFNKILVQWILSLFEDKRINPHGACLIFTTHYPELLDKFVRNDNIYVMIRDKEDYKANAIRYSDQITRTDLKKSNVLLTNHINGTGPEYLSIKKAEKWIIDYVGGDVLE